MQSKKIFSYLLITLMMFGFVLFIHYIIKFLPLSETNNNGAVDHSLTFQFTPEPLESSNEGKLNELVRDDDDGEFRSQKKHVESKKNVGEMWGEGGYTGEFIGTEVLVYGDSICVQASEMWKGLSKRLGFNMVDGCHNGRKPVIFKGNHPELETHRFDDYKPDLIILYGNAIERECVGPNNGWWYHRKKWEDKNCGPVDHEGFEKWIGEKISEFVNTQLDPTKSVPLVVFVPVPRAGKEQKMSSINDDPEHLRRSSDRNPTSCMNKRRKEKKTYTAGVCDKRIYHPYYYSDVVKAEMSIAKDRGNMKVLNMEQFLCPEGMCPAKIKGKPMWKDWQHTTSEYWVKVSSEFVEFLRNHGVYLMSKEEKDSLGNR